MNDRIRLALAMGWRNCEPQGFVNVDGVPTVGPAGEPPPFDEPPYIQMTPDPFTDANDDYAVLDWMRQDYVQPVRKVIQQPPSDLLSQSGWQYKVGDYARAALKVIDERHL